MSEIEKMYENAGVEKEFEKPAECVKNPYITCDGCMLYDDKRGQCNNRKDYPPFTAEKQLELIKWLAYKMHITIGKGLPWGQYDDDWWTVTSKKGYAGTNAHKLEEALANFANSLWQDLTESERNEIKEILQ